jgi:RNA polymerase sigma-70 factor, ECF subfamily
MALPAPVAPPAPMLSERDLVLAARRGDSAAGDEIVQRFRRPCYLLALQLLGNPDDALDVAQDSLLSFFTKLHRFEAERPVKPWLLAIVRNRAHDLLRRKKVRQAEPLPGEGEVFRPELIDEDADPAADLEQRELKARLWQALAALPEAQRDILVLRDYQDLSYSEIASVLQVPIGTVMSRLHRARATLRQILLAGRGKDDAGRSPF